MPCLPRRVFFTPNGRSSDRTKLIFILHFSISFSFSPSMALATQIPTSSTMGHPILSNAKPSPLTIRVPTGQGRILRGISYPNPLIAVLTLCFRYSPRFAIGIQLIRVRNTGKYVKKGVCRDKGYASRNQQLVRLSLSACHLPLCLSRRLHDIR